MKDNKQKRFEYLRANKAYLSEREKQEYYELVEEIEGWQALEEEYAADIEEERAQSESSSSERRSRSSRSLDSAPAPFYPNVGKRKITVVRKRALMMKGLRKQQVKSQRKRKVG